LPNLATPAKGIVCDNSSILLGFGVHTPSEAGKGLVNVTQAENRGVILTLKTFYSPDYATTRYVCEAVFGTTVGNQTGLVWLK
jgi:hypothetical protein